MAGKPKDGRTFSDASAAALLGVNERTVRRWRAQGLLACRSDGSLDQAATVARVNGGRDPLRGGKPDRVFAGAAPLPEPPATTSRRPAPAVDRAFDDRGDAGLGGAPGDAGKLLRARVLSEAVKAKLGQLRLRERTGELIPKAQAVQVYADTLAAARATLEGMPLRLSHRLVGLDAVGIRAALQAEVETILKEMANGLDAAG